MKEYVINFATSATRLLLTGHSSKFKFQKPEIINFPHVARSGIYVHIPFCAQLCPYCPYNRIPYDSNLALEYIEAVKKEIRYYSQHFANLEVESIYFGGGTPTILSDGVAEITSEIYKNFKVTGPLCIETNPADLTSKKVSLLKSMGVDCVSLGIQSFNPKFLEFIGRKYSVDKINEALRWLEKAKFKTVNFDLIFALPGQRIKNLKEDLDIATSTFADQITTYPLFTFPYSSIGEYRRLKNVEMPNLSLRKTMYYFLYDYLVHKGYRRASVWSFKKEIEVPRYSSVTRERYIGFGPGAGSFYGSLFTLNTFSVPEYINSVKRKGEAVALQMPFNKKLSVLYDFYWCLYDTYIPKARILNGSSYRVNDFKALKILLMFSKVLGLVDEKEDSYILTREGAFWLHLIQNYFSLRYINKIWSIAKYEAWPKSIEF